MEHRSVAAQELAGARLEVELALKILLPELLSNESKIRTQAKTKRHNVLVGQNKRKQVDVWRNRDKKAEGMLCILSRIE